MGNIELNNHQNNPRNSAIELCRIIVMFMIVASHFSAHSGFTFDKGVIDLSVLWYYVLDLGGQFGVDVFILISGYFLVQNTNLSVSVKKCLKLWGQVFFYSTSIFVIGITTGICKYSHTQLINALLPIISKAWWFATTYFVLFLLHPYLNRLLHNISKRQYQNFLLLLFFIWCIIPTFTSFSLASNELVDFFFFYVIAGYIRLHGSSIKLNSKHFFLLWLLATLVTYSSGIILTLLGKNINLFAEHANYFYHRKTLPTLFRAVFFFMIFERMTIKPSKIINTISKAAFGVYLIHDSNIIRPWLWKSLFVGRQYQDSYLLVPYSIIVALIVYTVCTLIDLTRIYTVEALFSKCIDKYCDKLLFLPKKLIEYTRKHIFGKE